MHFKMKLLARYFTQILLNWYKITRLEAVEDLRTLESRPSWMTQQGGYREPTCFCTWKTRLLWRSNSEDLEEWEL